jgi:hypothetical protein
MLYRQFGTVSASEIFSSGVLLSEYVHGYLSWPFLPDLHDVVSTDFRQFEQYLNVSGIDVRYFLVSRVIPILPT